MENNRPLKMQKNKKISQGDKRWKKKACDIWEYLS